MNSDCIVCGEHPNEEESHPECRSCTRCSRRVTQKRFIRLHCYLPINKESSKNQDFIIPWDCPCLEDVPIKSRSFLLISCMRGFNLDDINHRNELIDAIRYYYDTIDHDRLKMYLTHPPMAASLGGGILGEKYRFLMEEGFIKPAKR